MGTNEDYDMMYRQLLSEQGRAEIGDDTLRQERLAEKIQQFLDTYPKSIPPDKNPNTPWIRLSLYEILQRSIETAIDILKDISAIISNRQYNSAATVRRQFFAAFTREDRRIYVGIWLLFFSFVIYFIDSAA